MERRLVLVRHAKSAWEGGTLGDHERPLSDRGRRAAPRIAQAMLERAWVPEVALCSDAHRAVETWERMARVFPRPIPVTYTGALYHAGMGPLRRQLVQLPREVAIVVAIGHNPGWEQAAAWLTSDNVELKTGDALLLFGRGETWAASIEQPGGWDISAHLRFKED